NEGLELNVILLEQAQSLQEVEIDGNGEDPAYAIIKKTISAKDRWNSEAHPYECQVYIKGLQRLNDVPEKIVGTEVDRDEIGLDSTGSGIAYLFESVNRLNHSPQKGYTETILSSKVSGQNNAF